MEARALQKNIRISPRKMRLVIDLVRGKKASEALTILRFHPQHAAKEAEMVLRSAIANLNQKADEAGERIDDNKVIVKTAMVNNGPFFKRIREADHGKGMPIKKRSNHLTIIVGTDK